MNSESLRTRQTTLARRVILEAFLRHLEAGDVDDISIEELAVEAGVSRRTLYRYFPSRADLLAAAGEWIRSDVLALPIEVGDEGIAGSFRDAAERLGRHPWLARALLRTEAGRAVRGSYRDARVRSIEKSVRGSAPNASDGDVKRASAVLSYLCSSTAWTTIQDESGLDADSAQAAVVWAINTLLASLQGCESDMDGRKGNGDRNG
jgi:AcrR family transcriptional regulator